jgi:phosphopantetheine--protein transferase-like protein
MITQRETPCSQPDESPTMAVDVSGRRLAHAAPLVSRVLEAQQAGAFEPWESHNEEIEAKSASATPSPSSAADCAPLPFLGSVLQYEPGRAIVFDRRLSLQEDLYLADHAFVHAPGVKPLSSCLPVLPLTMSLEAMAEAAACLAPGEGLLGFENVTASRWIELEDTDTVTLTLSAMLEARDRAKGVSRIKASIATASRASPAIEATVIFGRGYEVELAFKFSAFRNPRRFAHSGAELYSERHMFHGPSFHCIDGDLTVGDNGVTGEFVVLSSESLFQSTKTPQLLACPTLLDAVGQIMGVWALEHERFAFPIGLSKLEIYAPTPPVGTRTPVRVEVLDSEGKVLRANIEIQDGRGGVWMRIADWRSWKFKWHKRIVKFRRFPRRYMLSEEGPSFEREPDCVFLNLSASELTGFDPSSLARYYLNDPEMSRFKELSRYPARQRQWLLGRIVAKDAVRSWLTRRQSQSALAHPASIALSIEESEAPFVSESPGSMPPKFSIAHCDDRAIAAAQSEDVGVDIERITRREPEILDAFISESERKLLQSFPAEEQDAWHTKLWCSKEAVVKLMGVSLGGALKALEATEVAPKGEVEISYRPNGSKYQVKTVRDGDYVIAYASRRNAMTSEMKRQQ